MIVPSVPSTNRFPVPSTNSSPVPLIGMRERGTAFTVSWPPATVGAACGLAPPPWPEVAMRGMRAAARRASWRVLAAAPPAHGCAPAAIRNTPDGKLSSPGQLRSVWYSRIRGEE
jgi:hypothetical protein